MIASLLLIALFGCAGIQQEETVKPREPAPQSAAAAVTGVNSATVSKSASEKSYAIVTS